ncbi:MAG: HNH endonuclease [Ignavibacteriaceae bacterium]|nr:HNH endonuclease [Ignavibacteriaceae bacterium]
MAFSQETKDKAYIRAGGKCECTRKVCSHHTGRCNARLANDWHAHHITAVASDGPDSLSNCEALCIKCHKNTQSYGR